MAGGDFDAAKTSESRDVQAPADRLRRRAQDQMAPALQSVGKLDKCPQTYAVNKAHARQIECQVAVSEKVLAKELAQLMPRGQVDVADETKSSRQTSSVDPEHQGEPLSLDGNAKPSSPYGFA